MIISVTQTDQRSIEDMQQLLSLLPGSHKRRPQIESDLYRMLSGEKGEKSVAFQLEFWFRNAEDVVVANNLRLEFNGRSAQIDHVIAVPAGLMIVESKSLPDVVHIDADGNWYREKPSTRKTSREGMFSPIEQNRRHIAVVEDILEAEGNGPKPKIASVIVFPNPKVVLTGVKPTAATLTRIDNLQSLVERSRRLCALSSDFHPRDWVDQLLEHHKPISYDVYRRYHIESTEMKPMNERVTVDPETEDSACAFCGTKMAILKTRNGLMWGCSQYPRCKNLVPASVVAQIGKGFVDTYNKEHFWTSRPNRCPNCGGSLVEKRGRNGQYRECVNVSVCKYKDMGH